MTYTVEKVGGTAAARTYVTDGINLGPTHQALNSILAVWRQWCLSVGSINFDTGRENAINFYGKRWSL